MASGDVTSGCASPGDSNFAHTSLNVTELHLPSKFSVYKGNCKEILIIGDSIIRSVILPSAFTYCLSGGKVTGMIELAPVLTKLHPSAHILIFHVWSNDVLNGQSVKSHEQLESLATTVQSLGKTSVFSGPIRASSKSSEHFGCLIQIHDWLKIFCIATEHGFINNLSS